MQKTLITLTIGFCVALISSLIFGDVFVNLHEQYTSIHADYELRNILFNIITTCLTIPAFLACTVIANKIN